MLDDPEETLKAFQIAANKVKGENSVLSVQSVQLDKLDNIDNLDKLDKNNEIFNCFPNDKVKVLFLFYVDKEAEVTKISEFLNVSKDNVYKIISRKDNASGLLDSGFVQLGVKKGTVQLYEVTQAGKEYLELFPGFSIALFGSQGRPILMK